jgi:hypothetical protein
MGEPFVEVAFHSMITLPPTIVVVSDGGALGATAQSKASSSENSL